MEEARLDSRFESDLQMPLVSIAIPTFNRAALLSDLLADVRVEVERLSPERRTLVQVCVVDNASTDNTPSVLSHCAAVMPYLRAERNAVNLGIEGNLIRAALAAHHEFTWLLSDHQKLRSGVLSEVFDLLEAYRPAMIVMDLKQWPSPHRSATRARRIADLSDEELGEIAFLIGNVSTNLYRTCLASESIQLAHQIAYSAYPHMAKLARLIGDDLICRIQDASALPEGPSLVRHYDTFATSFINHITMTRRLLGRTHLRRWKTSGFQRGPYTKAMAFEIFRILATQSQSRCGVLSKLFRAALANRNGAIVGRCSAICLSGALVYLLPLAWRKAGCLWILRRVKPHSVFLDEFRRAN